MIMTMQRADVIELRDCVLQCSRDVLPACAIPIGLDVGDIDDSGLEMSAQVVTFIGFSGPLLRGTLTLVAPFTLLHAAYPIPPCAPTEVPEADVLDWSGELVNQLLGRIKNRLAPRGVELMASTPKSLRADQPRIQRTTSTTICALRFSSGPARLGVWFDAVTIDERSLFPPTSTPGEACLLEGEVTLF